MGKQMLIDDALQIQDIAAKLGFQYAQSFISFFKNATGMTPGEYRSREQDLSARDKLHQTNGKNTKQ